MHNPKPKKNKYENTWKENFRATLMEEVERKFIEREKILQQKEHKVAQKKRDFEMKKKGTKITR